MLRPSRLHRYAAIVGQAAVFFFPRREILACEQVVGVLRRLGRHIDHRERHDERVRWNFFDGGTGLGEMDWCVQVRAGMFDDPPPIEIESILLEIEFLLHLNPRHTEEGREIGRHGMRQIDRRGEAARGRGVGHLWHRRRDGE